MNADPNEIPKPGPDAGGTTARFVAHVERAEPQEWWLRVYRAEDNQLMSEEVLEESELGSTLVLRIRHEEREAETGWAFYALHRASKNAGGAR